MSCRSSRRQQRLPRPITMLVATVVVSTALVCLVVEARYRRELAAMEAMEAAGGDVESEWLIEIWPEEDCPEWLADNLPEWPYDVLSFVAGDNTDPILESILEY